MVIPSGLSPLRRRKCYMIIALIVLLPLTLFMLLIGPDLTTEQALSQRLAEYQMRVQYLESLYRNRKEDLGILAQLVGTSSTTSDGTNITFNSTLLDSLSHEARAILRNSSVLSKYPMGLHMPNIFSFMPHLLDDSSSLRPAFLSSKNRQGVSVVLGIPTVKRDKQSYLMTTLQNLINNMNEEEHNETLIIVFVGDTNMDFVQLVNKQIEVRFPQYVENGLIEVISPSPAYYPNMNKLRVTLNDPPERVRWRSKQNLDYSYLMAYAHTKGTFYVQLEDDILAKKGFIGIMKSYAFQKTINKVPWFVLDFCQLGFIGKMFKSAELPYLITFFQMFYNDKPVDWLLEHFVYTKMCNSDKSAKHCKLEKAKIWIHYKPSLFQHIGTTSSLKGKVQTLKDGQFGKVVAFFPHKNPPAIVRSAISSYKTHTIQRAYLGETFFWGLLPQANDTIDITFLTPYPLKRFLFRSANTEHPSDKFYNTTVEIMPIGVPDESPLWRTHSGTSDGFLVVGHFNDFGVAEGIIDQKIGPVRAIRLRVHTESENWAILSEIHLQNTLNS